MTDRPVRVRPASIDDLDKIVAFNTAMAEETEGKVLAPAVAREGARQGLRDPARSLYFVATVGDVVVAQTMVTIEWSDWRNGFFWWIQSVYVDPHFRRRGVFRALHDHICREAKSRPDVCGLRLYVHRENSRAISTYQRLGMEVTDYRLCEEDWSDDPDSG